MIHTHCLEKKDYNVSLSVSFPQPLDYERRKTFTLRAQVENVYLDPRFHTRDSFRDTATVKVLVEDVDEPPVFKRPAYIMEVRENAEIGTIIGSVSAVDPDANRNIVK